MSKPEENLYIPYLSVAKADRVLELAKTRSMRDVSTSDFADRGFNTTDAALAVKFLRFLGAIDEEGKATDTMEQLQLQTDEKRKQAFEVIVRNAYTRLFDTVQEPHKLPQDELYDEMKAQYKQSKRITESAVLVFRRLCEHAGLIEEGTVTTKKHSPKKDGQKKSGGKSKQQQSHDGEQEARHLEKSSTYRSPSGISTIPIGLNGMSINLPTAKHHEALFDEELGKDLRNVLQVAKEFADKHLKDKKDEEINESSKEVDGGLVL